MFVTVCHFCPSLTILASKAVANSSGAPCKTLTRRLPAFDCLQKSRKVKFKKIVIVAAPYRFAYGKQKKKKTLKIIHQINISKLSKVLV